MDHRLQFNAEQLKKLLQLWKDCPEEHRSILSPGIKQLLELSSEADRYEEVRYPHIFFQFMCDVSISALRRGESLDHLQSTLIMAWNAVQLSIHLTDEPGLFTKLLPALTRALTEMSDLLKDLKKYKKEDNPKEQKLKVNMQRLVCEGALATLQILGHIFSKEKLTTKLQALDLSVQMVIKSLKAEKEAARGADDAYATKLSTLIRRQSTFGNRQVLVSIEGSTNRSLFICTENESVYVLGQANRTIQVLLQNDGPGDLVTRIPALSTQLSGLESERNGPSKEQRVRGSEREIGEETRRGQQRGTIADNGCATMCGKAHGRDSEGEEDKWVDVGADTPSIK